MKPNLETTDYQKYKKYKTKYLELSGGGRSNKIKTGTHNNIYYEIRGNNRETCCCLVLFSPQAAYDWDHKREISDGKFKLIKKFNFLERLSEITQTFVYDKPELAANVAIDVHQHAMQFPPINELDYESHVEKIHDVLVYTNCKPPYILVGHSMGAFNALVFAKKYPLETKAVILLDGTRHCPLMHEQTKSMFELYKTNMTDDEIQTSIQFVRNNPDLEKVIEINNYYGSQLLKYWNQVPDKLPGIKIIGVWNIWVIEDDVYQKLSIEKKYHAQIEFLETMKQYHELLQKKNGEQYESHFFIGRSHDLHHSNMDDVINIINNVRMMLINF